MTLSRPDILWIITTQWRAQATGYAGDPNARTPHLDALAADSRTWNFSQAVTPHPFGPFARAAMLTGIPSPENGVCDYFDSLPENTPTLAHDLSALGYTTAFFGKWHLGKRSPEAPLVGEAHARIVVPKTARGGFEYWDGFESGFLLNDPWFHGSSSPEPVCVRGYQSDIVCERALNWLTTKQASTTPKFCVLSMEAPHPPYGAPAPTAPWTPDSLQLPANVPSGGDVETQARQELAGYYRHIEATDAAIGKFLGTLRTQKPEAMENTIVVFTSAHGDMHGAHGLFRKGWPHEESVRVPLLVQLPKGIAHTTPRARQDAPISLIDLPSMMRQSANGHTLFKDDDMPRFSSISMPSIVQLRHQCDRVWRGIRTTKRKLVLNEDGTPWLFFDLESDPGETKNLVGREEYAAEIRALSRSI